MMLDHRVTLVFGDYAGDLRCLVQASQVWIEDTVRNWEKVKAIWGTNPSVPRHNTGVTMFKPCRDPLGELPSWLATIDEHHQGDGLSLCPWNCIQIIGLGRFPQKQVEKHLPSGCQITDFCDDSVTLIRSEK